MKIELTNAEAIVLSDLLYRISEKDEYYEEEGYQESIKQSRETVRKSY